MNRVRSWLLFPLALVYPVLAGFQDSCQNETAAWRKMEVQPAILIGPRNQHLKIQVKVADEEDERRAGFQHICPQTIARLPMLFQFQRSVSVAFHMNNVHAPLDIAFFDENGVLVALQLMQPYRTKAKRPVYPSGRPVRAALEAPQGFFRKNGISTGQWRLRYPLN